MSNITRTEVGEALTEYFMPYAMKTIVDRALPDVRDGLKPIHRRIIYKMYEMGLSHTKPKVKCHPLVGKVLEIHGHGDSSVYEALAMMTNQNESLLHPFIEGEGSFGKVYDTDSPSASRYTYARLNKFSSEMFDGLDKNVVDFIGDDYKQPIVLPNTFPNILVKPNKGMSVGFACEFPSFNLEETGNATKAFIKDENVDLLPLLNMDFPTGGTLLYNEAEIRKIYATGKGSVTLRSKYRFDGQYIEIYEIPYNTTSTAIIKKVNELLLDGNKFKEIVDIRDESEFNVEADKEELKIVIEVKKNTDVDTLMSKLYKFTPLQKAFSCNMNCLVNNRPMTLGVKAILKEWLQFREECIKRSLLFDINKKSKQLHNLKGLEKVLLNIDNVIKIIRETKQENQVLPNLMSRLDIDEIQAQYIAEIKLRNLNEEYIIKRTSEIIALEKELDELKGKANSPEAIRDIIISQLDHVVNTYKQPRKTTIVSANEVEELKPEIQIQDYNTRIFVTKDGYVKKIPLTGLRSSSSHNLKDGDSIINEFDSTNKSEILFFVSGKEGNRVYKQRAYELDDHKVSTLGTYVYSLFGLNKEDTIHYVCSTVDYSEDLLIGFEDGKLARISMKESGYYTKQNRKKLEKGFSDKATPVFFKLISEDIDLLAISDINKAILMNTSNFSTKASRGTAGQFMQRQKNDSKTIGFYTPDQCTLESPEYYKTQSSGVGKYLKASDSINN